VRTATTPRWGKLLEAIVAYKLGFFLLINFREGGLGGSPDPALVRNHVRDFASKGSSGPKKVSGINPEGILAD
jgi:hypothetical protein